MTPGPRINSRGENVKTEALPTVLTIGHSTRALEEFIRLLQAHAVTRVVDVRTVPRSRHNPQFNRDTLPASLKAAGIGYTHSQHLVACVIRHTTPLTPAGETPPFAGTRITCRRRSLRKPWTNSSN